jgi:hypothetical protein
MAVPNCGMGGRHTEKDYPESNVSIQEAIFVTPFKKMISSLFMG